MPLKLPCSILLLFLVCIAGCAPDLARKADTSFEKGDYRLSTELYGRYLQKHPDSFQTRRKYAIALMKNDRPGEAVRQFERIIAEYPRDYISLLYLGLAHLRSGHYRKTLDAWDRYAHGGKPLIVREVERQSDRIFTALPEISREGIMDIQAAIEGAVSGQKLRDAYNTSRLENCFGG